MKLNKPFACLLCLGLIVNHVIAQTASQLNASIESKVDKLLKQMTLEEKVGQMARYRSNHLVAQMGRYLLFLIK
jgi:hypothetical protein